MLCEGVPLWNLWQIYFLVSLLLFYCHWVRIKVLSQTKINILSLFILADSIPTQIVLELSLFSLKCQRHLATCVVNKDTAESVTVWDKLLEKPDCVPQSPPTAAALNVKCSFWLELMKHVQMTKIDNRLTRNLHMTKNIYYVDHGE